MLKTNVLLFVLSQQLKCDSGFNRRGWNSIRSRSTDKQTLMANMQLPHEHSDSETEVTPELQLHQQKFRGIRLKKQLDAVT